ncbi:hypothetical protein C0J52_21233, partial [Blattella germanica]
LEQHVFIYDTFVSRKSWRRVYRHFRRKYSEFPVPSKSTIYSLVKKFRESSSNLDKKWKKQRKVLLKDTLDNMVYRLECSLNKSLKRLSQETGISESTARNATKLLKLKPCKVPVVQALRHIDPDRRLRFCNWMLEMVDSGN